MAFPVIHGHRSCSFVLSKPFWKKSGSLRVATMLITVPVAISGRSVRTSSSSVYPKESNIASLLGLRAVVRASHRTRAVGLINVIADTRPYFPGFDQMLKLPRTTIPVWTPKQFMGWWHEVVMVNFCSGKVGAGRRRPEAASSRAFGWWGCWWRLPHDCASPARLTSFATPEIHQLRL